MCCVLFVIYRLLLCRVCLSFLFVLCVCVCLSVLCLRRWCFVFVLYFVMLNYVRVYVLFSCAFKCVCVFVCGVSRAVAWFVFMFSCWGLCVRLNVCWC